MNKRKTITATLLTAVAFFFTTVMFTASYGDSQNIFKENITIEITKKSSQTEIDYLVNELQEKGIDLNIITLTYNEKGHIIEIEGAINSNDGYSGSFNSGKNFKKVTISRNYKPFKGKVFSIVVR